MSEFIAEERLASWGPPDTSDNVFAHICPVGYAGHYGHRPTIRHRSPMANKLIKPGAFDRARYASRLQSVERYAWGLGDMLVHVHAPVSPGPSGSATGLPVMRSTWNHRTKTPGAGGSGAPATIRQGGRGMIGPRPVEHPRRRHVLPGRGRARGTIRPEPSRCEVERRHHGTTLRGDLRRGRLPVANPRRLPVAPVRMVPTADSGNLWQSTVRYGAFKATLAVAVSTYVMHAARDASGSTAIVHGRSHRPPRPYESAPKTRRVRQPVTRAMLFLAERKDEGRGVTTVGPGANLQPLDCSFGRRDNRPPNGSAS